VNLRRANLWVVLILSVAGWQARAQTGGDGAIFTEAAYVDTPDVARDRDWLVNYLSAGKTYEETENIRNQIGGLSVAQVRTLLRQYQQKQALVQQREAATKNIDASQTVAWPEASTRAWQLTETAEERERGYEQESPYGPLWWNPYMGIPMNPFPVLINFVDDAIPF
jgi:hypothetical protein